MDAQVTRCRLVHLYTSNDGTHHYASDCGPCSMLQMAYSQTGPWYDDRIVQAGQDIQIRPNEATKSAQYWRLIPWPCAQEEKAAVELKA